MDKEPKRDVSSSFDGDEGRRTGVRLTAAGAGAGGLLEDEAIRPQSSTVSGSELSAGQADATLLEHYESIRQKIRSWGALMIFWGVVQFFISGTIIEPWAVFLIIIGLSSFYFHSAAMLVAYTAMFCWVAFSNLLSGESKWMVIALIQIGFAIQTGRDFRWYRRKELYLLSQSDQLGDGIAKTIRRPATTFPWIALATGLLSLIGLFVVFVAATVLGMLGEVELPLYIYLAEQLAINLAVLGLAAGAASLLMRYDKKAASIFGLLFSALVIAVEAVFLMLP